MSTTTAKGYQYPANADAVTLYPALDAANAALWDARPGISVVTTTARNAYAGADLWDGRIIWNSTTLQLEKYDLGTTSWIKAFTAATPATSVTGPDTFGAAAVVGTSLLYARMDHDHGLPSVASLATAASVTSEAATRATADTNEATTRAGADTAEATTRASADTTLTTNLANEATTRASADAALSAAIVALEVYPAHTNSAGMLSSSVTLPASVLSTFIMDTASLGAGTWLLTWQISMITSAGGAVVFNCLDHTASSTYPAVTAVETYAAGGEQSISLTLLVTVNSPGTIQLKVIPVGSAVPGSIVGGGWTGYTAVRVA
jgi:hypothetical protein